MPKTIATQWRFMSEILSINNNAPDGNIGTPHQQDDSGTEKAPLKAEKANFRRIVIKSKPLKGCSGSAIVEMGNTRVSCALTGPKEQQSGESALEGTLNISLRGCIDPAARYTLEQAIQPVVCLKKLARTEVDIELNVLADDGGALAACMLAAGVAIASANIEMFDIVLACQVLIPSAQFPENNSMAKEQQQQHVLTILDPDQATISAYAGNAATLTIAIIPSIGQVISAEFAGTPLPLRLIQRVLPMAFDHCISLYPIVRQAMLATTANSIDINTEHMEEDGED